MQNPPTSLSYWILPGKLMAGEYPGAKDSVLSLRKVARFLELGFTHFIDLTEADEGLQPYAQFLQCQAAHQRLPIVDMNIPTPAQMQTILDAIDSALAAGKQVYVHCFGGHGRTGTVVGCWQIRHGAAPALALAQINTWRSTLPSHLIDQPSPQTRAQIAFVENWK